MFSGKYISLLALLWAWCGSTTGQITTTDHDVGLTIPAVAILDIEPNISPITLTFSAPAEAGLPLTTGSSSVNSSKWLNYSSAVTPNSPARTITAQVTSGTVPPGVSLQVQAGTYTGSGAGTTGTPNGLVTLGPTAQTVVSGILGCYTGNGASNGHQLTYSLALNNYGLLNFNSSTSLQITYTISD